MSKPKYISSEKQEQKLMKVQLSPEQVKSIVATLNPIEVDVPVKTQPLVATSLEYVKWSETSDEDVVHIGVMTVEDDDSVTLLTKYGEMTFLKTDGLFSPSSRTEFESVVVPVKEQEVKVVGDSKMSKATIIYQEMIKVATNRRIDIIKKFMSELDMSLSGASTYHQTIKVKLNK